MLDFRSWYEHVNLELLVNSCDVVREDSNFVFKMSRGGECLCFQIFDLCEVNLIILYVKPGAFDCGSDVGGDKGATHSKGPSS
jgi:hypothetical protein